MAKKTVYFFNDLGLTQGIVANGSIGTANQVLTTDGDKVYWSEVSATSVNAAGANTQIQFNDSGDLGASANLTYDKTTSVLSVDGKIGIGFTNPVFPLQVKTNTGSPPQALQLATTDWTTTVGSAFQFGFGTATGNTYSEIRALSQGYNAWNNLVLQSGGGNVGIGTTNPGELLHIKSASNALLRIDGGSGSEAGIWIYEDGNRKWQIYKRANPDDLNFYSHDLGVSVLTLAAAGGVGIGTTNPVAQLHISSSGPRSLSLASPASGGGSASYIIMGNNDSGGVAGPNMIVSANRALQFGVGNSFSSSTGGTFTPYLHISGDGNVSIGNTNPAYKLVISNAGGVGGEFDPTGVQIGGGFGIQAYNRTTSAYVPLQLYGSAIYLNGGNVGVGTTNPGYKLEVNGSSMFRDTMYFGSSGYISWTAGLGDGTTQTFWSPTSGSLGFYTNNLIAMFIKSNQSVGINTTAPEYRLHIKEIGVTAAAISTGWPAYNAESATQSKTVLYVDAGGNGTTTTAGQGASATVLLGNYYDSRGIITMLGAGGSSPSDGGIGYGKDLMVKGGNSDNGNGLVGGRLFLAGGSGYSGGAFGSNYGAVALQPQGGSVGIGTTNPQTKLDVRGGIIRNNTKVNDAQLYPLGHYSSGETIFEIDPTWSQEELQRYFNSANVYWESNVFTAPAGYSIYIDGPVNVGGDYGSGFPYIPVETTDIFYMECWIQNVGSGQTHYMGSIDYNGAFTSLGGNPGAYGYWVMSNTNPGSSPWVKVSGYISGFGSTTGTFVSGTKYWTPLALFNYTAGTGTRACRISGWKVIKVSYVGNRTFTTINFPNSQSIDTTTPGTTTYQLNFTGQATPNYAQGITWGWSSSGAQAGIYVQSSGSYGTKMYFGTTDSFATGSRTRMMIDYNGNVGIGTTNPSSVAKLHIEGNKFLIRSSASGWGQLQVANPNDGESSIAIAAGGTGSPGNDSTYTRQWIVGINPYGVGADRFAITNKTLQANTPFLITESGNIGIANTSPAYKLDIYGTGDAQLRLSGDTWAGIVWNDSSSTDYMYYYGPTSTFSIGGGGSSVSGKKLHVNGGMTIGSDYAGTTMPTNGLRVQGATNIIGDTVNGQSFYQWEGATYRNPDQHTPSLLIRADNSSTGINGSRPALGLYNQDGGDQTTVSMVFVSREQSGAGNAVNLAGIIAKKEIAGTSGSWTNGSLNFFTREGGTRKDNLSLLPNGSVQTLSNLKLGNDIAYPLSSWSAGSGSTGMVIFSFPGGSGNYGMVHLIFDIYEYDSPTVSTVIVGGHNWSGQWYTYGANVIGNCAKSVRLGFKDGKYCVVFGGVGSGWSYGTIILRKIHNASFYSGSMDMGAAFTTQQTNTESFSWVSGDLRQLYVRGPSTLNGKITNFYNSGVTSSNTPGYTSTNIEIQTSDNNTPAIGFHRTSYSATTLYEYDGQLYVNAWTTRAQTGLLLSSGNIGTYAPTTTGGGASGTWGINITGESRSVNLGGTGHTITSSAWAGGGGYHGYTYNGGNFRFGFSSTGGAVDVYADGNFYATDSSHLVLHTGNYNGYAPSLSGTNATGTWPISITGSANTVNNIFGKIEILSGSGGATFASNHYSMGKDIANGSWTHPHYSDLIIGYHTGIRLGAAYSGIRFYNNSPTTDANNDGNGDQGESLLMTVGGYATGGSVNIVNDCYAYGYRGHSNVAGTGQASYHPAGMYSVGTQWLYGDMYRNYSGTYGGGQAHHTILYKTDNTAYYIDPASTTSLRTVGSWRSNSGDWDGEFSGKIQYHSSYWYFQASNGWLFRNSGGTNVVTFDSSGNASAAGYLRAGTNVYTDANYGYGLVGAYASTRFQGVFAMGDSYKLPADGTSTGSLYGIAWSYPSAGGAASNLASHGMLILENGSFRGAWGGGSLRTTSDIRGTIFYDWNDSAYYCDPSSTSYLYHLILSGASYFRPSTWIQMDGSYGMYWPNTNGAHLEGNTLSSYGSIAIRGSRNGWRGIHFYDGGYTPHLMLDGSGNGGMYYESSGRWASYYSYGNNSWGYGSSTTSGSYMIYSSGSIYSTGNIVAYSDARKKENIITVENALEKINNLRGVYYNKIDDENKVRQIGVIAQEVNEVLPEVVTYAEDIDEYGVQYGNFAGLFIEAIKEQTKIINELKKEIELLKSKVKE